MRIIIASLIIGGGLLTMTIAEARQTPQPGNDPNFTGVVTAMDAKDITGGRRKFEAGARSAWHSHDQGQLLYAQSGRMRTGRRGEPFKEYPAGGSEYTAPNVEHWHGATPKEPLVQVNIQFGGTTKWLTKTTDDEYNRGR
ncbi:MAG TPA: cupin domain-containing protein [Vicinamibacterales bacterium]|nr:cupin domain-containing protein [Vicinamibacterales bacterium]